VRKVNLQQTRHTELDRLVFYSLVGGLTALIPFPWVDDWAGEWIRRRMVKELFRQRKLEVLPEVLDAFLQPPAGAYRGCLYQAFFWLIKLPLQLIGYLLRSVFRKLLIVLAVKQAGDRASRIFHEGFLLDAALHQGWIGPPFTVESAVSVQACVTRTLAGVDMSPVTSVFRQILRVNRAAFVRAAGAWQRLRSRARQDPDLRESYLEQERRMLGRVVAAAADLLGGQSGYLAALEARFRAELSAASAAASRGSSPAENRRPDQCAPGPP
jgi:hypothetical protein